MYCVISHILSWKRSTHKACAKICNHSVLQHRSTAGFSLVELSIVLVILGLLVGGVLTGQSLIRAAELRSITTDFERYQAAVNTFRDKYFALPGDMTNATSFWGQSPSCPGAYNQATTDGSTCNGDGNGHVN